MDLGGGGMDTWRWSFPFDSGLEDTTFSWSDGKALLCCAEPAKSSTLDRVVIAHAEAEQTGKHAGFP